MAKVNIAVLDAEDGNVYLHMDVRTKDAEAYVQRRYHSNVEWMVFNEVKTNRPLKQR